MHALIPILFTAAIFFTAAVIAVGLLKWRRNTSRKRKRSPLTSDLLRPPGQHIREQMDKVRDDVDSYVSMLMFVPLVVLAVHVSQSHFGQVAEDAFRIGASALMIVGGVAYCLTKLFRLHDKLDKLRIGYDAELAVGQELDQLMRQGAAVFHDFPAEKFNIDHIVISPVGVFAVETKGRPKPIRENGVAAKVEYDGKTLKFPGWIETKPIVQAERQAQWLRNWLKKAVGEAVPVRPVLAIPGWYVKRSARGGVNVYSGRELAGLVSRGGFDSIAEDKMQRIIHVVERECRNIPPTFNRLPKAQQA